MTHRKVSRLELYVEILKSIDAQPQSKFSDILEKTDVDKSSLVYAIDFLEKQDLIKKNKIHNQTVYENTARGRIVTRFFVERSQIPPKGDIACGISEQ